MSNKKSRLSKGFSIVELLIIIAVIGILASIVFVSYNGIQGRANDAAVQADLEGMSGLLEAYRIRDDVANPSHQFPSSESTLNSLELEATKQSYDETIAYNMIFCLATTGTNAYQSYKLVAKSKSGTIFMVTEDGLASHSLTQANLTNSLCTTLGMTLVSNGMNPAGSWKAWVHTG